MNIFADFHHGDLYYSLHLLFEKRLGHNLFRPIGMEWLQEGYWKIGDPYPDNVTAMQYLRTEGYTGEFPTNAEYYIEDGIYYTYQPSQDFHHKAITFETFKKMNFDIIISSIPAHDVAYAELVKKYQPHAKHISQMGNVWTQNRVKNVMCSFPQSLINIRSNQNVVFYNQEFSLNMFKYVPPSDTKRITSFVHLLPKPELFYKYKTHLSNFEFKAHGVGTPDGCLSTHSDIANAMSNSTFGWHVKPGGDGYGHCLHNWLACGRPIITQLSDYHHYSDLLVPDETCIDIGTNDFEENTSKILQYSEPEAHKRMCETTYKLFKDKVDFNNDAEKVKAFLEVLK